MKAATLVFEALAPVSIRAGREASASETLRYIPGHTLRGALASAHRLLRPDNTDEFSDFFLSGDIYFSNAYPSAFEAHAEELLPRPLPLTARSCKRYPGFDTRTGTQHGVVDQLIPSLLFVLTGQRDITVLSPLDACSALTFNNRRCGEPLQALRGFFQCRPTFDGYTIVVPRIQVTEHVGIDRQRRTAQQHVLYQHEGIVRGTLFTTTWRGEPSLLDRLVQFAQEAAAKGALRVGTARTRGFGELGLKSVSHASEQNSDSIAQRLDRFASRLHEYADAFGVSLEDETLIPLTFIADAILQDELGRYLGYPGETFWAAYGFPTGTRVVWAWSEARRIMGWNAVLGLPREDQWALAMGSVLVLRVPGRKDSIIPLLTRIETQGIGERKEDGFGRVVVADAFHTEVAPA